VVVGKDPGSKYDDALKMGVKTINEEEFRKLIGK
jgi:DNA ligase (NAD+)